MTAPAPLETDWHDAPTDLVAALEPDQLAYFLLNVGDGDSQVVLLPEVDGRRQAVVVDASRKGKTIDLLDRLTAAGLLETPPSAGSDGSIALVVATHPHADHIGGMAELLETQRHRLAEFWDPGYFHTTQSYHQMMAQVEANDALSYVQPTAGLRRWIGSVLVTVLAPAVGLRNRFDTYGTEVNDSSLSLRLEFPAARVVQRGSGRELIDRPRTMALILGADAQTLSWSYVLTDFPRLRSEHNLAARAIKAAKGVDPLNAKVMKVSHHGSKRGINLELMERVDPALTLVSSTADGARFHFPHSVAQELLREVRDPVAGAGSTHTRHDSQLGIFYTADSDGNGLLGSIAVVMGRGRATLWRFGDDVDDPIDLRHARRYVGTTT